MRGLRWGDFPNQVVAVDLDGDGLPEVAVTNSEDGTLTVVPGQGDALGTPLTIAVGASPEFIAAGDFDGNGWMDLVVALLDEDAVAVISNRGGGDLALPVLLPVAVGPAGVAVGDMDGDGQPDIVTGNVFSNTISVVAGATRSFPAGLNPDSIVLVDVDGDGDLDVLAAGNRFPPELQVLRNSGDGRRSLSPSWCPSTGAMPTTWPPVTLTATATPTLPSSTASSIRS